MFLDRVLAAQPYSAEQRTWNGRVLPLELVTHGNGKEQVGREAAFGVVGVLLRQPLSSLAIAFGGYGREEEDVNESGV